MLLIDHSCCFEISLIACCQKVGVNEKRGNQILGLLIRCRLPEPLQDFNVSCNVNLESVCKKKLIKILRRRINRYQFRLEIACHLLGCNLSAPLCPERIQALLLPPARGAPVSAQNLLRPELLRICSHPSMQEGLFLCQFQSALAHINDESKLFEFFHYPIDSPKCHARRGSDFPVG